MINKIRNSYIVFVILLVITLILLFTLKVREYSNGTVLNFDKKTWLAIKKKDYLNIKNENKLLLKKDDLKEQVNFSYETELGEAVFLKIDTKLFDIESIYNIKYLSKVKTII